MTDVPAIAQQWHDERTEGNAHEGEYSSCWCCCATCEVSNPHYDEARAAWRAESAEEATR
jgi:hypothetical protein